jgi:hypothetical protein
LARHGRRAHAYPWKFSGRPSTDRGRTAHRNDRALPTLLPRTNKERNRGRAGAHGPPASPSPSPVSVSHQTRLLSPSRAQLRPATCRASEPRPRATDLARRVVATVLASFYLLVKCRLVPARDRSMRRRFASAESRIRPAHCVPSGGPSLHMSLAKSWEGDMTT